MAEAGFKDIMSTKSDPFEPSIILNGQRLAVSRRSAVKAAAAAIAVGLGLRGHSAAAASLTKLTPETYLASMLEFGCECFSLVFVERDGNLTLVGATEYGEAFVDGRNWSDEKVVRWNQFRKAIFDMGPKFMEKVGKYLYEAGRREYCGPGAVYVQA